MRDLNISAKNAWKGQLGGRFEGSACLLWVEFSESAGYSPPEAALHGLNQVPLRDVIACVVPPGGRSTA